MNRPGAAFCGPQETRFAFAGRQTRASTDCFSFQPLQREEPISIGVLGEHTNNLSSVSKTLIWKVTLIKEFSKRSYVIKKTTIANRSNFIRMLLSPLLISKIWCVHVLVYLTFLIGISYSIIRWRDKKW